jgi:hypothetical protein
MRPRPALSCSELVSINQINPKKPTVELRQKANQDTVGAVSVHHIRSTQFLAELLLVCLTLEGPWAELLDPVLKAMLLQEAAHTPLPCTAHQHIDGL